MTWFDVTLDESSNILNCSSILSTISLGKKNIENELEEVQNSDWLVYLM